MPPNAVAPQAIDLVSFLRCPLCHALLRWFCGSTADTLLAPLRGASGDGSNGSSVNGSSHLPKVTLPSDDLTSKLLRLEAEPSKDEELATSGHLCEFHCFHRHRYTLWMRLTSLVRELLPRRRELFATLALEMECAHERTEASSRVYLQSVSRHVRLLQQEMRQAFRRALMDEASHVVNEWRLQLGEVEQQIGRRIDEKQSEISDSLESLERALQVEIDSKQARKSRHLVQEYAEEVRQLEDRFVHAGPSLGAVIESVQLKQVERLRFGTELRQALLARVQQAKAKERRGVAIWANKLANLRDLQEWQLHAEQELVMSRIDISVKRLEKEQAIEGRRIAQLYGQHTTHIRNLISRRETRQRENLFIAPEIAEACDQLPVWPWALQVLHKELSTSEGATAALPQHQLPKVLVDGQAAESRLALDSSGVLDAELLEESHKHLMGQCQTTNEFIRQAGLVGEILSTVLRKVQIQEQQNLPIYKAGLSDSMSKVVARCADLVMSFVGIPPLNGLSKRRSDQPQDAQALMPTSPSKTTAGRTASSPSRRGPTAVATTTQEAFVGLEPVPRHVKVKHMMYGAAEQRRSFMTFRNESTISTPVLGLSSRSPSASRSKQRSDTATSTRDASPVDRSLQSSLNGSWRPQRGAPPPRAGAPPRVRRQESDSRVRVRSAEHSIHLGEARTPGGVVRSRSAGRSSSPSRRSRKPTPTPGEKSGAQPGRVTAEPMAAVRDASRDASRGREKRLSGSRQKQTKSAPIDVSEDIRTHSGTASAAVPPQVATTSEAVALMPTPETSGVVRQTSAVRLLGPPASPQLCGSQADVLVVGSVDGPHRTSSAGSAQISACFAAPAPTNAHVQVSVAVSSPQAQSQNLAASTSMAGPSATVRSLCASISSQELRPSGWLPAAQAPPRRSATPASAASFQQGPPMLANAPCSGLPLGSMQFPSPVPSAGSVQSGVPTTALWTPARPVSSMPTTSSMPTQVLPPVLRLPSRGDEPLTQHEWASSEPKRGMRTHRPQMEF